MGAKFNILEWTIRILSIIPALFFCSIAIILLVITPVIWLYSNISKDNFIQDYTELIGDIFIFAIFMVGCAPHDIAYKIINN